MILYSVSKLTEYFACLQYTSMMSSIAQHSLWQRSSSTITGGGLGSGLKLPPLGAISTAAGHLTPMVIRGGMKNAEGPLGRSTNGLLVNLQQRGGATSSMSCTASGAFSPTSTSVQSPEAPPTMEPMFYDEEVLESMSAEMSLSALYMHEVHRRRVRQPHYENPSEAQARALWQTPETIQEVLEEDAASPRPQGKPPGDEHQRLLEEGTHHVDV